VVSADAKLGMKKAGTSVMIAAATKENRTMVCKSVKLEKSELVSDAKTGLAQSLAIDGDRQVHMKIQTAALDGSAQSLAIEGEFT